MIVREQPGSKFFLKCGEGKGSLRSLVSDRRIPRKILQKQLVDAPEKPFDLAASTRNAFLGKDQFDAQVDGYLLHMLASEV